jgi:hypothetical protein
LTTNKQRKKEIKLSEREKEKEKESGVSSETIVNRKKEHRQATDR